MVLTWGLVLWLDPGSQHHNEGSQEASLRDQEIRHGLEAERSRRLGPPKSLHASLDPDQPKRGRYTPSHATNQTGKHQATPNPFDSRPAGTHPLIRVRPGGKVHVRSKPNGDLIEVVTDRTEFGSPTVFSVVRVTDSWVGVSTPSLANEELGWIRLDPETVDLGWTNRSIHVKLSERRATVREHDRELLSFTVTVGAPGTSTPTGRFAVTDTFRGGNLNPVYGCCAVALSAVQPNLAPDWPGGDRIAIHGNGTGQPLGIAASNGCLRAEDSEVDALINEVDLGTPVFIYD